MQKTGEGFEMKKKKNRGGYLISRNRGEGFLIIYDDDDDDDDDDETGVGILW